MINYHTEAIKRMTRRGKQFVRWTLADRLIKFKYIPATEACNWDGSWAGEGNDPNQTILQMVVYRFGESPRYTNWW